MNLNANTQDELDAVIADAIARYEATPKEQRAALKIIIRAQVSPQELMWMPPLPHSIRVSIHGHGNVEIGDDDRYRRLDPAGLDFWVDVYGSVELTSFPTGGVNIHSWNTAKVDAFGGTVHAADNSRVESDRTTNVHATDYARVTASGRGMVVARDSANVYASGSVTVSVHEAATAEVTDLVKVTAHDTTTVHLHSRSRAQAYGQSTLHVRGPFVEVVAAPSVVVYRHAATDGIEGGIVLDAPEADDLHDAATWLTQHGVQVKDGRATLYKALDLDLVAGKSYAKPVQYAVGAEVACGDWRPNNLCGNGLHVSPAIYQAHSYQGGGRKARFLRVTVAVEDIHPINNGDSPKCKVPRLWVEAEVDAFGRELPTAPESGV